MEELRDTMLAKRRGNCLRSNLKSRANKINALVIKRNMNITNAFNVKILQYMPIATPAKTKINPNILSKLISKLLIFLIINSNYKICL